MTDHSTLTLVLAALVGVVAVARCTRLVTSDSWPPVQWARLRWLTWAAQTERRAAWADLLTCPFCASPYIAAGDLAWALAAGLDYTTFWSQAWWVMNIWAAVSYLSSMLVVRDEPPAEG